MNFEEIWPGWKLGVPAEMDAGTGGDENRALQRKLEAYHRKKRVMEKVHAVAPGLFYGHPNILVPEAKINALVDSVSQELSGTPYKEAHNFLSKGLYKGCEQLDWQLCVPSPLSTRFIEDNPLTPKNYKRLAELDRLVDAHETHGLSQLADYRSAEWVFGRFVFSLMIEGSLLNKHWLAKLASAVRSGVGICDGKVYITMEDVRVPLTGTRSESDSDVAEVADNEAGESTVYRRIFPGPTSTLLLLRYLKNKGVRYVSSQNELGCLKEYVTSLRPEIQLSKVKLADFIINTAITSISHELPGYLVHYVRSKNVSTSLGPEAWHRLTTDHVDHTASITTSKEDSPISDVMYSSNNYTLHTGTASHNQVAKYAELYDFLNTKGSTGNTRRKIIKEKITVFLTASHLNSPIVQAIGLWALHLLTHGSVTKSKIAISTLQKYLGGSGLDGRYLTSLASQHADLSALSTEQWDEIYNSLTLKARSQENRAFRQRLQGQFHRFLRESFDDIPDVEFRHGVREDPRVDSNIITPAEYRRAMAIIQRTDQPPRFRMMQRVALMLGYRCGLRRSEIQRLTMADVRWQVDGMTTDFETWVRVGKSESATRRFPLEPLSLDAERRELNVWLRIRETESQQSSVMQELFLCLPGQPNRPLNDLELFSPVSQALRVASGTPEVRFHHLRHTSISFTHVQLSEPRHDTAFPPQWAQDDAGDVVTPHWKSDLSRHLDLPPENQTTRTRLWAMSGWYGHISPGETLRSYAHLTDWVLGCYVWEAEAPALSMAQQLALLDISRDYLPVWRSRQSLTGATTAKELVQALGRQVWDRFLAPPPEGDWGRYTPPEQVQITTPLVKLLNPLLVYKVLASIEKDELNNKTLQLAQTAAAQRFHLSELVIGEWVYQAGSLMAMTTERRNGGQRYGKTREQETKPLTSELLDQSYFPELKRCLAPPRSPQQQNVSHDFFQRLIDWYLDTPEDCLASLTVFHGASQRSSGQVDFRDKADLDPAIALCRKLRLMLHTSLEVEVQRGADGIAAMRYWCRLHDLKPSQVRCSTRIGDQPTRDPNGLVNLRLAYAKSPKQTTYTLWPALRFAIFTASVVIDSSLMAELAFDRDDRLTREAPSTNEASD